MRYYLDTEFNGFHGELISLAMIREDGAYLYAVSGCADPELWVMANVMPILNDCPAEVVAISPEAGYTYGLEIARFLAGDAKPIIISDWPDDIRHFCEQVITGPGQMIGVPTLTFEVHRVDAYPTRLDGAVQHNAWWDAMALRYALTGRSSRKRRGYGDERLQRGEWIPA